MYNKLLKQLNRVILSLPYPKKSHFCQRIQLRDSDLTDAEYVSLRNFLIKHKNCYGTPKNDVEKIPQLD